MALHIHDVKPGDIIKATWNNKGYHYMILTIEEGQSPGAGGPYLFATVYGFKERSALPVFLAHTNFEFVSSLSNCDGYESSPAVAITL